MSALPVLVNTRFHGLLIHGLSLIVMALVVVGEFFFPCLFLIALVFLGILRMDWRLIACRHFTSATPPVVPSTSRTRISNFSDPASLLLQHPLIILLELFTMDVDLFTTPDPFSIYLNPNQVLLTNRITPFIRQVSLPVPSRHIQPTQLSLPPHPD